MRIGGAQGAPPPSQTGRADLPHPAFRSAALDGLAQASVPRCSDGTYQPRSPFGPAHPVTGGPLPANKLRPSGFPPRRRDQPCGTTSALARWPWSGCQHCVPTPLGSMVVTHFFATTGALTPADPFLITCRGSLISPSPPQKRRRGPGRGGTFYQFPLSPTLSPLVPRGEREAKRRKRFACRIQLVID